MSMLSRSFVARAIRASTNKRKPELTRSIWSFGNKKKEIEKEDTKRNLEFWKSDRPRQDIDEASIFIVLDGWPSPTDYRPIWSCRTMMTSVDIRTSGKEFTDDWKEPSKEDMQEIHSRYLYLLHEETKLANSGLYSADAEFYRNWMPAVLNYLKYGKPKGWTLPERAMWSIASSYGYKTFESDADAWKAAVKEEKNKKDD